MHNRLIFLTVLALMIVGTAFCELSEVTKIPASQDVYFGWDKPGVYNTDTLMCAVNVTDINGSRESIYSGVSMMQFNISGLNITENDIGILVLKAASIEKQGNEPAMIAMMPVGSDWRENSSYLDLVFGLKPVIDIIEKNDISKMGISTDGDKIVAFDVSKKLLGIKDKGDLVSFMLMPLSNSSYSVDFKSRETGEGPYLIAMHYPSEARAGNMISLPSNESAIDQTAINQTAINQMAIQPNEISDETLNNSTKVPLNNSVSNQALAQMDMMDALKENKEKTTAAGNT